MNKRKFENFAWQLILNARNFAPALSDGVMVAQGSLEAFVMVRIHVGQPFLNSSLLWRLGASQS